MSWVDDTMKNISGKESSIDKAEVKKTIRDAAIAMLNRGYDWDDIELFMVATLRPVVGGYILLFAKWLREVRNEEREVLAQ